MNKTIFLNENYGRKLRDEIMGDPSKGLRGEVEIQVKNRNTGKIESQQKHNLVVYGGREWLLKKAFNTNVSNNDTDFIRNSEILWFGIGNGGGEPGNPLQCGCTYGSDDDLYNPIRIRSEFNTNAHSTNPYYASRILPSGEIVNGYYKKITYVAIKEDQANPYKINNIVHYPNLIAEIRLEISPDDICGKSWLGNDYEKSYGDINEAALFIADSRCTDPGQDDNTMTRISYDYTSYNDDRRNMEPYQNLPQYTSDESGSEATEYSWTEDTPFPNLSVQYFNIYPDSYEDIEIKSGTKTPINTQPILMGIYSEGSSSTTGYIRLNRETHELTYHFENGDKESNGSLQLPEDITSLDDLKFLSTSTIFIKANKSDKIINEEDKPVLACCFYRNTYNSDFTQIDNFSSVFEESDTYYYFLPAGYVYNDNQEWIKDESFTLNSIIRIIQAVDLSENDCVIREIVVDQNTFQCKCYVDNDKISKFIEGMKICTYNDSYSPNKIPEDNMASIVNVYDATSEYGEGTTQRSYFIIERRGFVNQVYNDITKYPDGGLNFKYYRMSKDKPYIMFNRVTFSTIRISMSRDIILIWRIYF